MSKQILDEKQEKQILFAKNLEKGRIAEFIAMEDYKEHGFSVTRTGTGSDFVAEKQYPGDSEPYREYVEVKAGNSTLSRLQKITKSKMKRLGVNYTEYVVSDLYIENYVKENTISQVLNSELLELIPDDWENNESYKINIPSICPHCNLIADSLDAIITKFGLRKMSDSVIRSQSWCRKCRSLSIKYGGCV